MTDQNPKKTDATTPGTPVDEKAKSVAPANEPIAQPVKVAPEAIPAKES